MHASNNKPKEDSPAVTAHLTILQSIIQRMANNSSVCKASCITLVSAIIVLVADKGKPNYTLIAIIPTILFLILDTYYLALEKAFRDSYDCFVKSLHHGTMLPRDLYVISRSGNLLLHFINKLISFSVWPFYLTLVAVILIAKKLVM